MKRTSIKVIFLAVITAILLLCVPAFAEPDVKKGPETETIETKGVEWATFGFENDTAIYEHKQKDAGDHDPGRTGTNFNENEYDADRKETIAELQIVKYENSVSVLQVKDEYKGELAEGKYEVDVVKCSIKGDVKAGLYVTEYGPDGSKKETLEPGVAAEGEVKVAVVSASGEGRLGWEDTNVNAAGEADVLNAKAKASVQAGIVDGGLALHGEAGAEANLVEASGEVGGKLLGVGGKVNGSVKVGVGAKLSGGYRDGKFSAKVGLSIGVGVEVGFEIDVKEIADKATDVAKDVYNKTVDTVKDVYNYFFGDDEPAPSKVDLTNGIGGGAGIVGGCGVGIAGGYGLDTGIVANPGVSVGNAMDFGAITLANAA